MSQYKLKCIQLNLNRWHLIRNTTALPFTLTLSHQCNAPALLCCLCVRSTLLFVPLRQFNNMHCLRVPIVPLVARLHSNCLKHSTLVPPKNQFINGLKYIIGHHTSIVQSSNTINILHVSPGFHRMDWSTVSRVGS